MRKSPAGFDNVRSQPSAAARVGIVEAKPVNERRIAALDALRAVAALGVVRVPVWAFTGYAAMARAVNPYGDGRACERIFAATENVILEPECRV
jgi:uncharacterized membrane protein YeiB